MFEQGTNGLRLVRASRNLLLLAVALAASSQAGAQSDEGIEAPERPATELMLGNEPVPVEAEYTKRIRAAEMMEPLSSELFGDSVSLYSGQTEFNVVDIDIPGNGGLPVQLRRRLNISVLSETQYWDYLGAPGSSWGGAGDWDIDVPYVSGVFPATNPWERDSMGPRPRCSNAYMPSVPGGFEVTDIWSGNRVHIPGEGDKTLLQRNAGTSSDFPYPSGQAWTTADMDRITCVPTANGQGEGFLLTTKEGVSYRFDHFLARNYAPVEKGGVVSGGRVEVFLLATEVRDRHDNWVKYNYAGAPENASDIRLREITSSDGRKITLTYSTGNPAALRASRLVAATTIVSDVTPVQTRTWTYSYVSSAA